MVVSNPRRTRRGRTRPPQRPSIPTGQLQAAFTAEARTRIITKTLGSAPMQNAPPSARLRPTRGAATSPPPPPQPPSTVAAAAGAARRRTPPNRWRRPKTASSTPRRNHKRRRGARHTRRRPGSTQHKMQSTTRAARARGKKSAGFPPPARVTDRARALDAAWTREVPGLGNPFRTRLTHETCVQPGIPDYISVVGEAVDRRLPRAPRTATTGTTSLQSDAPHP